MPFAVEYLKAQRPTLPHSIDLLEVALNCVRRGWYVFPCVPRTKRPLGGLAPRGVLDASKDESQIRAWWAAKPDANVAIACGPSGLSVVDCDHGNQTETDAREWMRRANLPKTYTVHTGRRLSKDGSPEYGVQLYYADTMPSVGDFALGGGTGQVKSLGGYVMAAGSIHPSGETYEVLVDAPVTSLPGVVRSLKTEHKPVDDDGQPITENRNIRLTSIAGKLRNAGLSAAALEVALIQVNADRCEPPLDEDEVKRIAASVSRYAIQADAEIIIGGNGKNAVPKEPVDWRTRYMTEEQYLNVKPPQFLIDGFLVKGSIAMLGGPVAQRKSIIALNIARALCTGESLFGYFDVTETPARTVYLCPEMGAASFVKRIKQIGLGNYIGKTLFIQTMNEHATALDDLDGELPGAVVIVDTITRFIEGDESKSDDMRKFAQKVFRLVNAGATVVLLHHSKKGSTGTLDDGLRGSSELAAFVDSCWITELEDTKRPYDSLSKMRNVKQRDFESDPFRLTPKAGSYALTMAEDPAPDAVVASKKEAAARDVLAAILHEHPKMGINKLRDALKAKGHGKGNKWVAAAAAEMRGSGCGAVLASD